MPDTIAIQIDSELAASLQRLAQDRGRGLEEMTEEAIRALLVLDGLEQRSPRPPGLLTPEEQERETRAALADLAAGNGLSEEQMDEIFDDLLQRRGNRE